jgi:hypothetical protein
VTTGEAFGLSPRARDRAAEGAASVQETSFRPRPSRVIRFDGAGRKGVVRAWYGVTARPDASGFSAIHGFRGSRIAVGFPTLKCEVTSDRPGYLATFGWIQWVTQEFADGRPRVELVDRVPSMLELDLPFLAVGYAPSFFDAPAFNSLPQVDWRAALFLCTVPIMDRREPIVPLVGLRWGYSIPRAGGAVVPVPIERGTDRDWRWVRRNLLGRHPRWRFSPTMGRRPRTASGEPG